MVVFMHSTCTCTVLECTSRSVIAAVLGKLLSPRLYSREFTVDADSLFDVSLLSQQLCLREVIVKAAILT